MTRRDDQIANVQTRVVRIIREKIGLHEQYAVPIAQEVVNELFKGLSGERVYVTRKDPDIKEKVLADFTGANRAELCLRYKISKATFYRFIQKPRKK